MKKWGYVRTGIATMALIGLIAGCSNKEETSDTSPTTAPAEKAAPPTPVTLKFGYSSFFTDEAIKKYFVDPLAKKYPHITLELINYSAKGNDLASLIAAKNIPDIYIQIYGNMNPWAAAGLLRNIEPEIKALKIDLNRIEPQFLNSVKVNLGLDYIPALPILNNAFGLIYNKNLFDRFGVAYPKDNMTWQDARALADRLSRNDGGIQYIGLHPGTVRYGAYQVDLPYIDPKTDKGPFQTTGWKEVFQDWYNMFKLPNGGFIPKTQSMADGFYNGTTAMIGGYSLLIPKLITLPNLQWDAVTYPTNPKAPGVGQLPDNFIGAVSSTSKYPKEAVQAISVFISDDVQLELSKDAQQSILKDRAIQDQFGKNVTTLQGKNVVAFTKLKYATAANWKYAIATAPSTLIEDYFNTVVYDGVDMNTALRNADEEIDKQIQEAKRNLPVNNK
jgi:multiple sugar transport system substrate-binding protein